MSGDVVTTLATATSTSSTASGAVAICTDCALHTNVDGLLCKDDVTNNSSRDSCNVANTASKGTSGTTSGSAGNDNTSCRSSHSHDRNSCDGRNSTGEDSTKVLPDTCSAAGNSHTLGGDILSGDRSVSGRPSDSHRISGDRNSCGNTDSSGRDGNSDAVQVGRFHSELLGEEPTLMEDEHESGAPAEVVSECSIVLAFVVAFSALTGLLMGFDLSIVATVLPVIVRDFNLCSGQFTCFAKQLFVSILAPGAAVGGLIGGLAADVCGRRFTLALSDSFVVVGSLVLFFAHGFGSLLIGRLFVGAGIGIGFVMFSTYISEIAPADRRGQLVTCQEVAQCAGVNTFTPDRWRALLAAPGVVALIQMFGILFLPESPRWLISRGRTADAQDVIRRLGIEDERQAVSQIEAMCREKRIEDAHCTTVLSNTTSSVLVSTAHNPVRREQSKEDKFQWTEYDVGCSISSNGNGTGRLRELKQPCLHDRFEDEELNAPGDGPERHGRETDEGWRWSGRHLCDELKAHKVQVIIAIGVGICQNLIAANAMLYYSYDLFVMAGVRKPNVLGIGLGVMKLIGVVTTVLAVDTIGRRRLLLLGSMGTFTCHILLAGSFLFIHSHLSSTDLDWAIISGSALVSTSSWLPWLFCSVMFAFMFFWEISWASLMFVVASEVVLPSAIRGVAMGIVVLAFWLTCFLSQICFETSFYLLTPPGTFTCLCILNISVVVFVYLCIPETKGRSLEQISSFFRQQEPQMSYQSERVRDREHGQV
eukprot:GHVS01038061.1.p1 GENE.GHVS01038061.1~~GHVS01038061.1.p1  ORF type:complete len:811 (+),score=73.03 GHVS01038061.1:148-2433(+)